MMGKALAKHMRKTNVIVFTVHAFNYPPRP